MEAPPLCRETHATVDVDAAFLQTLGDRHEQHLTASSCSRVEIIYQIEIGDENKVMQVKSTCNSQLQHERDVPENRWVFSIVNYEDKPVSMCGVLTTEAMML